ncbi:hypothetical protein TSAR_013218 [Trichomalopsis sarcophagae]|uniref:tRNA-splicing endonuclease subunit Sen15 domain-containing protein n=1 Tax=Trichomalopsis sarcophagae TaxID=543379 RepID=A0A232FJA5_9HYME|nr:hypothetical protein TSAR_013218 [Trichomalopsis sarcophagae]
MYDICHPTYYNMSQLGCNDQVKLTTAFYVYMELCEVKLYWNVEYKYCEALQIFYLEAKKSKNAEVDTFVPWPAFHNLSLDFISNIQHKLEKDKFTFVFKEGDTTSVYYSISSGIVKAISPEETKTLRQKLEKKIELNKEISRNTANLYERALLLNNGLYEKDNQFVNNTIDKEDSAMEEFYIPMAMKDVEKFKCSTVQKLKSDKNTDISYHPEQIEDVNNSSSHCKVELLQDKNINENKEVSDLQ